MNSLDAAADVGEPAKPALVETPGLIERAQQWCLDVVGRVLRLLGKGFLVAVKIGLMLAVAVLTYAMLYWVLVPQRLYERPLHFNFQLRDEDGALQPPTAVARFGEGPAHKRLLHAGQMIDAVVELELPETPENREAGLFMVELELLSGDNETLARASRPCMLRYRSPLHALMRTLAFSTLLLSGLLDEAQRLRVHFEEGFLERPEAPLRAVAVRLSDERVQLYSAGLTLVTRMRGLAYGMYHYRAAAFAVGVAGLFAAQAGLLAALRLYRFLHAAAAEAAAEEAAALEGWRGAAAAPPPSRNGRPRGGRAGGAGRGGGGEGGDDGAGTGALERPVPAARGPAFDPRPAASGSLTRRPAPAPAGESEGGTEDG
eukprot:tig00001065_g6733.t1